MQTVTHLRLRLGMSQAELAKAAKMSPTSILSLEKGHRIPRAATIKKVAKVLQVETTILWEAILASNQKTGQDKEAAQ